MIEERLLLDAELWLVEELLFSARRDRLVTQLEHHGLSTAQARQQVDRLDESEGMARLRRRLATARRAEGLDRLRRQLDPPPDHLPVADRVDRDTLWDQHWIRSRPLHLPGWGRQLAPVRRWTFPWLREQHGDAEVEVNVDRRAAQRPEDVERRHDTMPFAALLDLTQGPPSDASYAVSRSGLLARPGLQALWNDLRDLPSPLIDPEPPRGAALWIGPAGTHTRAHFDPHNVLLVQVQGRKRVRLAPPPPPEAATTLDGWYLRGALEDAQDVELGPGDALFLPAGWLHEVRALAPSITLSLLCFGWPNHFHFLGPTGSDDV